MQPAPFLLYAAFYDHRQNSLPQISSEWLVFAKQVDDCEGGAAWRMAPSGDMNTPLITATSARLRRMRRAHDVRGLMLALSSCMDRAFANIQEQSLYKRSQVGTKAVIEAYLIEVCASVDLVAESEQLSIDERLTYLCRCRQSLGRTGLALSGGGALALAHGGVVRTLLLQGLLPGVVCGASGGAIIAAVLAIHDDRALLDRVLRPETILSYKDTPFFDPLRTQLQLFLSSSLSGLTPRAMDKERFAKSLRAVLGEEETFGSAFSRTGRSVSIVVSVASGTGGPTALRPVLLNYFTAPDVLIWSAVAASCALPGLMLPSQLLARDHRGRVSAWSMMGCVYDGSLAGDLGSDALRTLFGCSTLVCSQTNPHIAPLLELPPPHARKEFGLGAGLHALEQWLVASVQQRTRFLAGARLIPRWFGGELLGGLFLQTYSGDVTIVPRTGPVSVWQALQQPSESDMRQLMEAGQRATWGQLAHVRAVVCVEKALSTAVRALRLYSAQLLRAEAALPSRLLVPAHTLPLTSAPAARAAGPSPACLLVQDGLAIRPRCDARSDESDSPSPTRAHTLYVAANFASFSTMPPSPVPRERAERLRVSSSTGTAVSPDMPPGEELGALLGLELLEQERAAVEAVGTQTGPRDAQILREHTLRAFAPTLAAVRASDEPQAAPAPVRAPPGPLRGERFSSGGGG